MQSSKEHKIYMSREEFVFELASRTKMSEIKANDIMTAILKIFDENLRDNQSVHFDTFDIQLLREFPDNPPAC